MQLPDAAHEMGNTSIDLYDIDNSKEFLPCHFSMCCRLQSSQLCGGYCNSHIGIGNSAG